jgi:tRNA-uridine aminocarboxypropyltransferase
MHIFLLTHQKERHRKTNTGQLVLEAFEEKATMILWERKHPDPALLNVIQEGNIALLYPSAESKLISEASAFNNYIVIDGTWQEAQKIYNHSPYLQSLPHVKVACTQASLYHLRRNQTKEGLCTVELVMEVCNYYGDTQMAEKLEERFTSFLTEQ